MLHFGRTRELFFLFFELDHFGRYFFMGFWFRFGDHSVFTTFLYGIASAWIIVWAVHCAVLKYFSSSNGLRGSKGRFNSGNLVLLSPNVFFLSFSLVKFHFFLQLCWCYVIRLSDLRLFKMLEYFKEMISYSLLRTVAFAQINWYLAWDKMDGFSNAWSCNLHKNGTLTIVVHTLIPKFS